MDKEDKLNSGEKDLVESKNQNQMSVVGNIGQIEPYIVGDCFVSYMDRMEQYFIINRVTDDIKSSYFISMAGTELYKILKSLSAPLLPSKLKMETIKKLLEDFFAPKVNVRAERFKFQKATQNIGETISNFIIRLRSLAESCDFGSFIKSTVVGSGTLKNLALEDALLDKFIVGINDSGIQQVLLSKSELSFKECCDIAINMEMSRKEQQGFKPNVVNSFSRGRSVNRKVNRDFSSRSKSRSKQVQFADKKDNSKCPRCGRKGIHHNREECPAKNWKCYICENVGHTSNVCKKSVQNRTKHIEMVKVVHTQRFVPPAELAVIIENEDVCMEVDTGSATSFISQQEYATKLSMLLVKPYKLSSFITITGQCLNVIGQISVNVKIGSRTMESLTLLIVNTDKPFKALLGRDWLSMLNPNWKLSILKSADVLDPSTITCQSNTVEPIVNKNTEMSKSKISKPEAASRSCNRSQKESQNKNMPKLDACQNTSSGNLIVNDITKKFLNICQNISN